MNPCDWTSRQLIGVRAILTFVLAFLVCAQVRADVLVRNCATATASCPVASWVKPSDATNVQVKRDGAPFVPLAEVQGSERIAACYDDPGVVAGSSTTCAARVPGRSDLWQLKSILYPPVGGSLQLTVDATNPRWDSGAPLASNQLSDLKVRLYGAEQGQPKLLLDSVPWAESLKFRRESGSAVVFCFAASLALDTDGDSQPNEESPTTGEWCGTFASPPPVLHLLAPNGISGQAPAP
jgi:hypothetical protein